MTTTLNPDARGGRRRAPVRDEPRRSPPLRLPQVRARLGRNGVRPHFLLALKTPRKWGLTPFRTGVGERKARHRPVCEVRWRTRGRRAARPGCAGHPRRARMTVGWHRGGGEVAVGVRSPHPFQPREGRVNRSGRSGFFSASSSASLGRPSSWSTNTSECCDGISNFLPHALQTPSSSSRSR